MSLVDELRSFFDNLQEKVLSATTARKSVNIEPDNREFLLMQAKLGFFEGVRGHLDLTERQRNMLALHLSGVNNEEIAFKHGTSSCLVEARLEAIRQHLGCNELNKHPFLMSYAQNTNSPQ